MRFAELGRQAVALEHWLLPGECLLCQDPLERAEPEPLICALCRRRWRPVPDPVCHRCGHPSLGSLECRICPGWPSGLTRVRSAVWLDESARRAVHFLKYEGWWRVAEAMAGAMRRLESLRGAGILVPIPLSPSRLAKRGYNQSELIARELGRLGGLPVRTDLLRRIRETPTQTALTPEARQANVAGAFRAGRPPKGSVILVDDVFTTGATLAAAGAELAGAGAEAVEAITFARTKEPVG